MLLLRLYFPTCAHRCIRLYQPLSSPILQCSETMLSSMPILWSFQEQPVLHQTLSYGCPHFQSINCGHYLLFYIRGSLFLHQCLHPDPDNLCRLLHCDILHWCCGRRSGGDHGVLLGGTKFGRRGHGYLSPQPEGRHVPLLLSKSPMILPSYCMLS